MFAVVFEVLPLESGYQRYLDMAAALRPQLDRMDGFLSIERFRNVNDAGWVLSLSLWRDEAALVQWRNHGEHRAAQREGRQTVFADYRLRVVRLSNAPEPGAALLGLHEYPPLQEDAAGKRFASLTTGDRHIDLYDFAQPDDARAWLQRTDARPPARLLYGSVLRDYGMFERQQAPQNFPSIERSSHA